MTVSGAQMLLYGASQAMLLPLHLLVSKYRETVTERSTLHLQTR